MSVRKTLTPRREPYWGPPLDRGSFVGVRKLEDGTCTWVARMRDEDGRQKYHALGQATEKFDYPEAKKAAETWFKNAARGIAADGPSTVKDACVAYVEALRANTAKLSREDAASREAAAHDVEMRFKRTVYEHSIAKVRLDRLRTAQLKAWRSALGGAKASENRNWTAFRAALHLAVENKLVDPAVAIEWRSVKQHRIAKDEGRRDLYLDLEQRRALIAHCEGGLRDLVELAALTGARPGEIAALTRGAFDSKQVTVKFKGKTGVRVVPLAPAAFELCKRLAKSKHPEAPLLTRDDGQPWRRWDWDELIRAAAEKAELPSGVCLYVLRHCWITDACRAGMPTLEVARITGTSLAMIEDHYGKYVRDDALRERLAAITLL